MLGQHKMVQTILSMLDDEGRVILEPEAMLAYFPNGLFIGSNPQSGNIFRDVG